jgi:hypothetical protein
MLEMRDRVEQVPGLVRPTMTVHDVRKIKERWG